MTGFLSRHFLLAILLVMGVCLFAFPATAQSYRSEPVSGPSETNPLVTYLAELKDSKLLIHVVHQAGYHTYKLGSDFPQTTVGVSGGLEVTGSWSALPHAHPDMNGDEVYEGDVLFSAPVKRSTGTSATIVINGQVCDIHSCMMMNDLEMVLKDLPATIAASDTSVQPEASTDSNATNNQPNGHGASDSATNSESLASIWSYLFEEKPVATFEARLFGNHLVMSLKLVEGWKVHSLDSYNIDQGRFAESLAYTLSGGLEADGAWKASPPTVSTLDEISYSGTAAMSVPVKATGNGPLKVTIVGVLENGDEYINLEGELGIAKLPAILRSLENSDSEREAYTSYLKTLGVGGLDLPAKASGSDALENSEAGQLIKVKDRWVLSQWGGKAEDVDPDLMGLIWLAIIGGLIALLMPCVYPMIPITVSFFSKQAESRGGSTIGLGLIYGLGVVTSYTGLGFALTLALGATGVSDFGNNVWTAGAVAVFFLIFGLSMLGAFELRLPSGLAQKFNMHGKSNGAVGSYLLGTTFAVTSMACTVPVVGTILAAAASGDYINPLIGMVVYSSVVALPFVILAAVPGLMKKMPKAGGWMNSVKIVFGFIEIAAAAEFFGWTRLISRQMVLAIWVVCFVLAGLYLLGLFRAKHDMPSQGLGAARMVFATLFFSIALWILPGMYGQSLGFIESFLRSDDVGTWIVNPDLDVVLKDARDKRKAVFVDVTGHN